MIVLTEEISSNLNDSLQRSRRAIAPIKGINGFFLNSL